MMTYFSDLNVQILRENAMLMSAQSLSSRDTLARVAKTSISRPLTTLINSLVSIGRMQ